MECRSGYDVIAYEEIVMIDTITFMTTLGYYHYYYQSVGLNNDIQSIL